MEEKVTCTRCGKECLWSENFCSNCGQSLRYIKHPHPTSTFVALSIIDEGAIPRLIEAIEFPKPIPPPSLEQVQQALKKLRPYEAQVLIRRFGLDGEPGRTRTEIGNEVGVSNARIRQIEIKALRKLRYSRRIPGQMFHDED